MFAVAASIHCAVTCLVNSVSHLLVCCVILPHACVCGQLSIEEHGVVNSSVIVEYVE